MTFAWCLGVFELLGLRVGQAGFVGVDSNRGGRAHELMVERAVTALARTDLRVDRGQPSEGIEGDEGRAAAFTHRHSKSLASVVVESARRRLALADLRHRRHDCLLVNSL